MSDELSNNAIQVARAIQPLKWNWRRQEWNSIVSELNLQLIEQVQSRETYSLVNESDLSVYFSDNKVEHVEIDLAVFVETDSLDSDKYDEKISEFQIYYEQCLHALESHLGFPNIAIDSDDYDAIESSAWRLKNAFALLLLSNQGFDVPIILSIRIIPPIG